MPLLDHFHPPLKDQRRWEGFHGWWAAEMGAYLNGKVLPPDYFAEFQIHVGSSVEIDVGTFKTESARAESGNGSGGVAVAQKTWAPPTALTAMPAVFPDDIEIRVFSAIGGPTLVAVVELVSPGNKDRPEARRTFAAKCLGYLQRGIGLVIVDVVTNRRANMHNELVGLLGIGEAFLFRFDSLLYATAYHPVRREEREEIDWWAEPLTVGQPMPIVPLPVRGLSILPLDLESTYSEALRRGRLA